MGSLVTCTPTSGLLPALAAIRPRRGEARAQGAIVLRANAYDDFRSNGVPEVTFLDEDNARECLDLFINSDYGGQMFGCHDLPRRHGITGGIELVEIEGPEVIILTAQYSVNFLSGSTL